MQLTKGAAISYWQNKDIKHNAPSNFSDKNSEWKTKAQLAFVEVMIQVHLNYKHRVFL